MFETLLYYILKGTTKPKDIHISLNKFMILTEHSIAKITQFTQILKQHLQKLSVKLSRNTCLEKMTLAFIKTFIKDINARNANFHTRFSIYIYFIRCS